MTNEEFINSISKENEAWKEIPNYNGRYYISSLGRVASLSISITCNTGTKFKSKTKTPKQRILCSRISRCGYEHITLYKNNKGKTFTVHRLVAEAFIPNPENKPQIDHIDRNRSNNTVSNLRWCTGKENMNNENTIEWCKKIAKTKINTNVNNWIPVICLLEDIPVKVYPSLCSAEQDGFKECRITMCCRNLSYTHRGLRWMYLDDYNRYLSNKLELTPSSV